MRNKKITVDGVTYDITAANVFGRIDQATRLADENINRKPFDDPENLEELQFQIKMFAALAFAVGSSKDCVEILEPIPEASWGQFGIFKKFSNFLKTTYETLEETPRDKLENYYSWIIKFLPLCAYFNMLEEFTKLLKLAHEIDPAQAKQSIKATYNQQGASLLHWAFSQYWRDVLNEKFETLTKEKNWFKTDFASSLGEEKQSFLMLHLSTQSQYEFIIKQLLKLGADPEQKDHKEQSPKDLVLKILDDKIKDDKYQAEKINQTLRELRAEVEAFDLATRKEQITQEKPDGFSQLFTENLTADVIDTYSPTNPQLAKSQILSTAKKPVEVSK
ncbi:MAG: hypothetical protein V4612_02650 [Pseudomonadota bacterium]